MNREFEGGDFFVTARDDSPENVKAAEMAAKVLAHFHGFGDEWRIEAFKAAQAETPGRWPSAVAIRMQFERIAREAIQQELSDASQTDPETPHQQ